MALLVAALLGGFGNGWLSATSATTRDGTLRLAYERFARLNTPTEIRVTARAGDGGGVAVSIDRSYTEAVEIAPGQPPQIALAPDRTVFRFPAAGPGQPVTARIRVTPQQLGLLSGTIRREPDGEPLSFTQFVYP